MTVDLWMLVASALLFFLLYGLVQGFAVIQLLGLSGAAGNRESVPVATGWKGRIDRTVDNHSENLIVFAILVVVAQVSSQANDVTAAGAVIFFAARVVHAVCYVAGLPWMRTVAWVGCVIGMATILSQLF